MKLHFDTDCTLYLPDGSVLEVKDQQLEVEESVGRMLLEQLGSQVRLALLPEVIAEERNPKGKKKGKKGKKR